MDTAEIHAALALVRAIEVAHCLEPGDWPDVAVALLLEGADVPELDELAGLRRGTESWEVEPLVARLYDRFQVPAPSMDQACEMLADALATDLRRRPAGVTGPMVRILADCWPEDSELVNRAWYMLEFLDCGCHGREPLDLEAELEQRPDVSVCDAVLRAVMSPVRAELLREQPPSVHD